MQTKDVTIDQILVGDWFFLGGRLYKVSRVEKHSVDSRRLSVLVTFYNPAWMSTYNHTLEMDAGFPMQVLKQ